MLLIGDRSVWEVHTNKEAVDVADKQRAAGPKIPKKKKGDPDAPEEVKNWDEESTWIIEKIFTSGINKAKGSGLGNGNMSCIMLQFK